jgi:rubrerythrin
MRSSLIEGKTMAAYIDKDEQKERIHAIEILKEQIQTEAQLINLYEQLINRIENKPIQHMFRMIQTDSKKHVDMLQSAKAIIQGQDILIKDRKALKTNLIKHLEFEKQSIAKGDQLLRYQWIKDKKGLHALLKNWRDEEKRHHNFLKTLANKPYISISSNDWHAIFGTEESFFEKRYLRSKKFYAKKKEESKR